METCITKAEIANPDSLQKRRFDRMLDRNNIQLAPWQKEVAELFWNQPKASGKSLLASLLFLSEYDVEREQWVKKLCGRVKHT